MDLSQSNIPSNIVLRFLKINLVSANNTYPVELTHSVAFHPGFTVCQSMGFGVYKVLKRLTAVIIVGNAHKIKHVQNVRRFIFCPS